MSAIPIPKTAPFLDEEIELLNRVVGPASPTQRAWLAGFLAGVEASSAAPQPAAAPLPAEPLTIVFASESGNSERLAGDIAKAARKNGLKPTIVDMADLDVAIARQHAPPRGDRRHLGRRRAAGPGCACLCRADG
jgi:sulfite reductase (NADPH) flavoprotein alpha-component